MSQIIISNGQVSIQFIQYVEGETDMIISRGKFVESFVLPSEEAKAKCKRHLDDKEDPFKIISINGTPIKDGKVVESDKKVASIQKKSTTPKKPWTKDSRKAYAIEKKRYIDSRLPEIRQYFKNSKVYAQKRAEIEKDAKAYMKSWEANQK